MAARKKTPVRVIVDGCVSDGRGGHLPKGHDISSAAADTLASLKAKGFAA